MISNFAGGAAVRNQTSGLWDIAWFQICQQQPVERQLCDLSNSI